MRTPTLTTALAAALLAGACAHLQPARMALPETLAGATALPFDGLSPGRRGRFVVEGLVVRYDRGADRLSLFDRVGHDRLSLQFEVDGTDGALRANCRGRRLEAGAGIFELALRPLALDCRFDGSAGGQLTLAERHANTGIRAEREGRITAGAVTLELRSQHTLAGTPLPLAQPAGYLMLRDGRVVAAVELTSGRPVLYRSTVDDATAHAARLAAIALGLLWDPAISTR